MVDGLVCRSPSLTRLYLTRPKLRRSCSSPECGRTLKRPTFWRNVATYKCVTLDRARYILRTVKSDTFLSGGRESSGSWSEEPVDLRPPLGENDAAHAARSAGTISARAACHAGRTPAIRPTTIETESPSAANPNDGRNAISTPSFRGPSPTLAAWPAQRPHPAGHPPC